MGAQIQCHTVAFSEWDQSICSAWAEVLGKAVTGNLAATRADLSLPCLRCKPAWVPFSRAESGFSRLSVCPSGPLVSQGGLSSPCRTLGLGCPVCVLTHSLPRAGFRWYNLPLLPHPLPGAVVLTLLLFFPSYPVMSGSSFQPWLCRSASFRLVFSENCSPRRWIFDVFVGGGELHILLLPHLDLRPQETIL